MMKKIITFLLCLSFVTTAFCSCAPTESETSTQTEKESLGSSETSAIADTVDTDVTNETDTTVLTDIATDKITETPDSTDKVTDAASDTGAETADTTRVPVETTRALVDTSDKPDEKTYESVGVYAPVLSSKAPYYEDGQEPYVSDNSELIGYNFDSYTLLDMDGDGNEECLLAASQIVLVLHSEQNVIYGYTFGFRGMDSVYKNGTFGFHGFSEVEDRSQCYGLRRICAFTPSGETLMNIWRVDMSEPERFYIGEDNRLVTESEFRAYAAQYDLEAVKWIGL